MIDYFKVNDPFRAIVIIVIIALFRMPFYLYGDVLSVHDTYWFLLGDKIDAGLWLYSDIVTWQAPLTGMIYGLIEIVFGQSVVVLHIISFLLVCFQMLLFNYIMVSGKIIHQGYLPALVYGVLMSLTPDMYTLSSIVLGNTFILLILNFLFSHMELRVKRDEKVLLLGFYTSISVLLFSGFMVFIPATLLLLVLYTKTAFRRYLMYLHGIMLPIVLIVCLYLAKGETAAFMDYLLNQQWELVDFSFSWNRSMYIYVIFLFLSLATMVMKGRFTNFQLTMNVAMGLWLLFSVGLWFAYSKNQFGINAILVPGASFFIMLFFTTLRSRFWSNLYFAIFLLVSVLANLYFWKWDPENGLTGKNKVHESVQNPFYENVKGKKVWSVTDEWSHYYGGSHAGKVFDPVLFDENWKALNYETISAIYDQLNEDMPQVIIDPENRLTRYFERIPEFSNTCTYHKEKGLWTCEGNEKH